MFYSMQPVNPHTHTHTHCLLSGIRCQTTNHTHLRECRHNTWEAEKPPQSSERTGQIMRQMLNGFINLWKFSFFSFSFGTTWIIISCCLGSRMYRHTGDVLAEVVWNVVLPLKIIQLTLTEETSWYSHFRHQCVLLKNDWNDEEMIRTVAR